MNEKLAKLGIAVLAFVAIAAPTTFFANAYAQDSQGGPPQGGPGGGARFGGGQGGPGGPGGQGGGQFRPMGGGGGAIAVDASGVYVLQGNRVFKLDKNSLKVVQEGELPMPQPPQGGFGGGGGRPGGGGGFGGGGGQGGQGGLGGGGGEKK